MLQQVFLKCTLFALRVLRHIHIAQQLLTCCKHKIQIGNTIEESVFSNFASLIQLSSISSKVLQFANAHISLTEEGIAILFNKLHSQNAPSPFSSGPSGTQFLRSCGWMQRDDMISYLMVAYLTSQPTLMLAPLLISKLGGLVPVIAFDNLILRSKITISHQNGRTLPSSSGSSYVRNLA